MVLFNQQLQVLNRNQVNLAIQDYEEEELLSEEAMETELEDYYNTALQTDVAQLVSTANVSVNLVQSTVLGRRLLDKIRTAVCNFIQASSTQDEIIDAILDAVSSVIPGGIFIAGIVKKLIKYLLNLGFNAICPQ